MKQHQTDPAERTRQLAQGPIFPLLIKLTVPIVMAQAVNALYSLVDRMYIGHMPDVGTDALTGLGLTFPVIMIIAAFSCLPGMGGAPLASIAMGAGDTRTAQKYLGNAITLLVGISILLTVGFGVCLDPMLRLFGANDQTLPYALGYLRIYLLGTIFVELATGLNPFISTQGFTGFSTFTTVIGAGLNLVLDPLFIYTFDMGIEGAAIATVISQFVSAAWVMWFLSSRHTVLRVTRRDLRPDWKILRATCALGVSPFTFRVNESIVVVLLNQLLLQYGGAAGNLHIASMATLASIGQVFFMPLIGIISGAQPILSYNRGAKNHLRLRQTVRYARILSIGCAVLMWALIMLFPRALVMLFSADTALLDLTEKTMRLQFCTVLVLGLQMVNQNAFVALGNTKLSFLFGIMRKVLILLPLAYLLPRVCGVYGIYLAEAISNLITTVVTHVFFERYLRRIAEADGVFDLSVSRKTAQQ